jgi:hypothetical protein
MQQRAARRTNNAAALGPVRQPSPVSAAGASRPTSPAFDPHAVPARSALHRHPHDASDGTSSGTHVDLARATTPPAAEHTTSSSSPEPPISPETVGQPPTIELSPAESTARVQFTLQPSHGNATPTSGSPRPQRASSAPVPRRVTALGVPSPLGLMPVAKKPPENATTGSSPTPPVPRPPSEKDDPAE